MTKTTLRNRIASLLTPFSLNGKGDNLAASLADHWASYSPAIRSGDPAMVLDGLLNNVQPHGQKIRDALKVAIDELDKIASADEANPGGTLPTEMIETNPGSGPHKETTMITIDAATVAAINGAAIGKAKKWDEDELLFLLKTVTGESWTTTQAKETGFLFKKKGKKLGVAAIEKIMEAIKAGKPLPVVELPTAEKPKVVEDAGGSETTIVEEIKKPDDGGQILDIHPALEEVRNLANSGTEADKGVKLPGTTEIAVVAEAGKPTLEDIGDRAQFVAYLARNLLISGPNEQGGLSDPERKGLAFTAAEANPQIPWQAIKGAFVDAFRNTPGAKVPEALLQRGKGEDKQTDTGIFLVMRQLNTVFNSPLHGLRAIWIGSRTHHLKMFRNIFCNVDAIVDDADLNRWAESRPMFKKAMDHIRNLIKEEKEEAARKAQASRSLDDRLKTIAKGIVERELSATVHLLQAEFQKLESVLGTDRAEKLVIYVLGATKLHDKNDNTGMTLAQWELFFTDADDGLALTKGTPEYAAAEELVTKTVAGALNPNLTEGVVAQLQILVKYWKEPTAFNGGKIIPATWAAAVELYSFKKLRFAGQVELAHIIGAASATAKKFSLTV